MFNSYGWIQLGMNRTGTDMMDERLQEQIDKLDIQLDNKVKERIKEIIDSNEIIKFDFTGGMNNLESFLTVQLSRNHFSSTLREFYNWISKISDGSHGVLYEINNEEEGFDSNKPYRLWRLIGNKFEECSENVINEKYHIVNYMY